MLESKRIPPRGILHRRADAPLAGYARFWPDADLLPWVEHLWTVSWDVSAPASSEVLAHPSVQLVLERSDAGDDSRVGGVHTRLFVRTFEGRGWVLGTKFRPGAFRAILGRPVSTIANRMIELEELVDAATARAVERAALGEADPSAAFAPIQRLVRSFPAVAAADPAELAAIAFVGEIAGAIAADREITRVEQVAERFGLGVRKLQRLFDDRVGASPKWVIQRYRLHEAAERIAAAPEALAGTGADLAAELGYADQAHFIRDFKRIVGRSPADYAKRLRKPFAVRDPPDSI